MNGRMDSANGRRTATIRAQRTNRFALIVVASLTMIGTSSRGSAQERGGLTGLGDLGVGLQSDATLGQTQVGLSGLNVGVGGFLGRDLALMFRVAGTSVAYDIAGFGDYTQISGFAGPTLQWWLSDRFNVEAGAGAGLKRHNSDEVDGRFAFSSELVLGLQPGQARPTVRSSVRAGIRTAVHGA